MGINEYIKIGSRIKKIRKAKGISQKEMAKNLGLAHSTYSNYENDLREPKYEVLKEICSLLEVEIDEVMGRTASALSIDLNSLRHKINLTKEEFSNLSKIPVERYVLIEEGIEEPTEEEQTSILRTLDLSGLKTSTLHIFETANGFEMCTSDKAILKYFNQLNEQGQKKAVESVELLTKVPEYKK